jgi:hypothetical protein
VGRGRTGGTVLERERESEREGERERAREREREGERERAGRREMRVQCRGREQRGGMNV